MSFLINPYAYAASAPPFDPATLFTGGEVGDFWRFDAANTDANAVNDPITVATGVVNGLLLEEVDPAGSSATLTDISGNIAGNFNSASERMDYDFGSTIAQPATIIICIGDNDLATHIIVTGSAAGSRMQISNDSSDNIIMFAGSTLDTTINANFGTKVFTAEFNGASSKFRQNGTQTATGNAGTQGTNRITISALWDGTFPGSMNIYSLLFIDRILTSTELDDVERLMGSHAGLSW